MKHVLFPVLLLALFCSCANENTRQLNGLVSYIDSLEKVVDEFHRSGDTTYYTSVIDPAANPDDALNQKQDTAVVPHANKNYFTGRQFAGITIEDDLLEMVTAEYKAKRDVIDIKKLSAAELQRLEEAEAKFTRITTEFTN